MMRYAADYITEENKNRQSWNQLQLRYMISDWRGYVINAEKLDWNLKDSFILFPKNFEEAHDRAADLAEIENAKIMDAEVQKQEMQLNESYGYSTKSYLIRDFIRQPRLLQRVRRYVTAWQAKLPFFAS